MLIAAGALAGAVPAHADVPPSLAAYARARAAEADGSSEAATVGYRAALQADPGNVAIAGRAYRRALIAGDMALARTAAGILAAAKTPVPDAALLEIADAVRAKDWGAADAAADRLGAGAIDFLVGPVKAWIALGRGDAAPEALLVDGDKGALVRRFAAENRALLLIAGGRKAEGVAALRALIADGADNPALRVAAAQLLAGAGERRQGEGLLAGDDPVLSAVRAGLRRGTRPSAAFGISRLFVRLAGDLVDGDARPLAISLTRAALEIDRGDDRARLTLAGALSNAGAQAPALTLLDGVNAKGPYVAAARTMATTIVSRSGDTDRAIDLARQLSAAKGAGPDEAQRLGDLLVGADRFAEAADAYGVAIARSGAKADWLLYMQQGGALDRAGRWAEAKPLLERAVELAPREPHALNYLGYTKLERGEDVTRARALLERASALAPDDAAITDSLGWAYVKSDQPARALPLLERAARAEPGDVTINEHLGDVYWMLGRRFDARYAWRAAAVFADGEDATRITGKLADGLAD
ncbi:tetratricopeptide repeat protein [Sphingomonas sp.]|uniref:tetratricopeptide repeat protein n=1 Tax=Sphingomonas sp. TaxID=28214 RepID=UPI002DD6505F|nr:tetratricopeptide repeat protein [Sphingomonas sp.]